MRINIIRLIIFNSFTTSKATTYYKEVNMDIETMLYLPKTDSTKDYTKLTTRNTIISDTIIIVY